MVILGWLLYSGKSSGVLLLSLMTDQIANIGYQHELETRGQLHLLITH